MNKLLLLSVILLAQVSQAALNANCDVWSHNDGDPNLEIHMVLPFTIGHKLNKMPTSPSTLTVIDSLSKETIFSDEISHLNEKSSDGVFEEITKNTFPITKDSDILKPKAVPEKMRRLKLDLALLSVEKGTTNKINFNEMSFDVDQVMPNDSTLTGEGSVTIAGKKYEKMTFRCNLYIAFEYYERLAKSKK